MPPIPFLPLRALWPTVACALVLTLALAGCSMPKLAYQQADWLLLREMDSYLDLQGAQREKVALTLEASLSRHRTERLPALAQTLREAAQRVRRGFTEADARWAFASGRGLFAETVEFLLPTVASALGDLSAPQREHLAAHLAQRNADYADSHGLDAPAHERLERAGKRNVERIEQWTGTLSDEQRALVLANVRTMPDTAQDWLAYSRDRQQALLALLEARATPTALAALLRDWWIDRTTLPAALAHEREQRDEARIALIVQLGATLDSVQREHLLERIEDLAADARTLIQAAAPSQPPS